MKSLTFLFLCIILITKGFVGYSQEGITVSAISGNTSESGGTATFTIVLDSEPLEYVYINLSSDDTGEGTVAPEGLMFAPANWNVAQTVTVTGVSDDIDDGDKFYSIITSAAISDDYTYSGMNVDDVAVMNTDDDIAGITVSAINGNTTELGGTATFTIVLDCEPYQNVYIELSSDDTGEGTVAQLAVMFTPVNWNVAQTVTVTGVDDDIDDGDQVYSIITASALSTDDSYSGMNANDVAVINTDNDMAGITVSAISGNTTESGVTTTFTIVLDSEPTSNVNIGLSSNDPGEGTVSQVNVTFAPANWDVPQTVTVTGVDDDIDDGDQVYSIITSAATSSDGNYYGMNADDVEVINDNIVLIEKLRSNFSSEGIQFFPNPAKDILYCNSYVEGICEIIDFNGKLIYTNHIKASKDFCINISELSSGTYFIRIINSNTIYINKLIVY